MRDIKSNKIGKLMSIVGTITKTTEARPELLIGSFTCQVCGALIRGVEQQFKYTTPKLCTNRTCTNKTKWELNNTADSTFVDWQKLRVQEISNDIPAGSMPRSIDVIVRNELVEVGQPGDRVVIVGTPVVVPDLYSMLKPGEKYQLTSQTEAVRGDRQLSMQGVTGLRALGVRDLNYKIVFIANSIEQTENRFGTVNIREDNEQEIIMNMTEHEKAEILDIKNEPNLYHKMAKSICPMVFGNDEIKKGILLMLFGGINKKTPEGIKLRGDINICTVGDPSTAKSQFLKYIHGFLPRSVYTSGKATSAAGLTASVQRDPETGEFTIEAGALMLADNGICCIDEFDKMDDEDQVAIHEAMEQQTISITKAGIQATLNARTSILAAANPIMGRYDKSKTLKANLNISPPIMSRFDLFFVVCDDCEESTDRLIAKHIVTTHQKKNEVIESFFPIQKMQRYIRFARTLKPQVTKEAAKTLRDCYVRLRSNDLSFQQSNYRITVRQLESLVRLSEAHARLHLEQEITPENVKEAARLLSNSILKVHKPDLEIEPFRETITEKKQLDNPLLENADQSQGAKKIVMKNSDYEQMARQLTLFLEREERKGGEDYSGVLQRKMIEWYSAESVSTLNSMDEYQQMIMKLRAVINRLLVTDRVFIIAEDSDDLNERKIKLHPNFYMD